MNQELSNTASENDQTIIETPSPKPESELTTSDGQGTSDVPEPTPEAMPESGGEELTTSDGQRTSDVIEPTPEATPEITPEPELTTSDGAEPTPVPELSQ